MSYAIQLAAKDGTVTVTSVSGQVPDGTFGLSGHYGGPFDSVAVTVSRAPETVPDETPAAEL
jgi:hypothetical protein